MGRRRERRFGSGRGAKKITGNWRVRTRRMGLWYEVSVLLLGIHPDSGASQLGKTSFLPQDSGCHATPCSLYVEDVYYNVILDRLWWSWILNSWSLVDVTGYSFVARCNIKYFLKQKFDAMIPFFSCKTCLLRKVFNGKQLSISQPRTVWKLLPLDSLQSI